MFDYGWRQYMPDLGRWNGIDQLAENYLSISPYAYVANNPVSQFDVDGRWFNQDGTIDTSGRTPGFTTGRQYYFSFLGIDPNYSEGGGESAGSTSAASQASSGGGNSSGKGFDGEVVNIPEVILSGKSSLMFGLKLRSWVNAYMKEWNAQNKLFGRGEMGMLKQQNSDLVSSYFDGFVGGAQSSWNYIKGQFFGESYWNGLANTFTLGAYGTAKTINSLIDVTRNIPNYTANDYSYGAGYLTEKAAEAIILKEASQINPFGIRGGYGFKIGKVEFLYSNPSVGGGTIFSYVSATNNKFRLDYHGLPSLNRGRTLHFHTNYWGYTNSPHRSLNPFRWGQPIKLK